MGLSCAKFLAVASVLAAASQAAPIALGSQVFHKDWAAACDNMLACTAVSLKTEAQEASAPTAAAFATVRRDSDGAVRIDIALAAPQGDRYRLFVDSRLIASGALIGGKSVIHIEGSDAMRLARAMGRGRKLTVRSAHDALLGQIGLDGTAAAFAHIDAVQGRNRTRTALFAAGRRSFKIKPAMAPTIMAQRIGTQAAIPDAGAIVGLVESSACAAARVGVTEDSAYSLGRHAGSYKALVMLSCGSGAYNFSSAPFIGTSGDGRKWSFAPARFDYPAEASGKAGGINLLVNAGWVAGTQQISSYAKGRGLGDCGNAETYVWDGAMFRLIEAHGMNECRGSTEWMRLWTAKVEFSD